MGRLLGTIDSIRRRCLSRLGVKRKYLINGLEIELDFSHALPDYQRIHPNYDKFLSEFVRFLPSNSVVVDVGANVGDSLAAMAGSNDQLQYVCIEADPEFFEALNCNVEALINQRPGLRVNTAMGLVGRDVDAVALLGSSGTKRAVPGAGSLTPKPLQELLNASETDESRLQLLKVDVDGYDWDVLGSAFDILKSQTPAIFFECQFNSHDQLRSYQKLFRNLFTIGYSNYWFFDNFGNFMLSTQRLETISDLVGYLARMSFGGSTKTLGYFDILAWTEERAEWVDGIIATYASAPCSS
ncbi:MAG: FkbM family methyltransferase [Actinomycetota bacterium]|nr:FkbM family methyltransferase [Actinomycetota bacterium]